MSCLRSQAIRQVGDRQEWNEGEEQSKHILVGRKCGIYILVGAGGKLIHVTSSFPEKRGANISWLLVTSVVW